MNYSFAPVGILHSCFKEKFAIPRQAGLVSEALGRLEILPPYNRQEAFVRLKEYSHLWLIFVFHGALREGWKPTVRPPRLGGNQRVGVFATRSPFRPNPIGLSSVELHSIEYSRTGISLLIGGIDLLDKTPVLDIKPYLPYADAIPNAQAGFASPVPTRAGKLDYSADAEAFLARLEPEFAAHLRRLIREILENDPRPAYLHDNAHRQAFGMRIYDYDIRWRMQSHGWLISSISSLAP
jgi:tRNA-Thr(GGU) m(6)t(6)A37 methyltransferase TsaA